MKPKFDTDSEYDEWFEKKQTENILEGFDEVKYEVEIGHGNF